MNDLSNLLSQNDNTNAEKYIEELNSNPEISDSELYEHLTLILNSYENKNNSVDAVRIWVKEKINELIELMNGDHPVSLYTKETLGVLMEKYFEKIKE